jgi:nucleolar protein 14
MEFQKRKAVEMKTYLPKFEEHYSVDKRYTPNRDLAQLNKLKFEYKKQLKGAQKELRKDGEFIARERIKSIREKDQAYKHKIDQIMGQLANQEGAMRGYEREKKKPRKRL